MTPGEYGWKLCLQAFVRCSAAGPGRAVFPEMMGYLNVPSFVELHKGEVQARHGPELRPSRTE